MAVGAENDITELDTPKSVQPVQVARVTDVLNPHAVIIAEHEAVESPPLCPELVALA